MEASASWAHYLKKNWLADDTAPAKGGGRVIESVDFSCMV
jgi:hypothetical protein